jgi:hypothetical protein
MSRLSHYPAMLLKGRLGRSRTASVTQRHGLGLSNILISAPPQLRTYPVSRTIEGRQGEDVDMYNIQVKTCNA